MALRILLKEREKKIQFDYYALWLNNIFREVYGRLSSLTVLWWWISPYIQCKTSKKKARSQCLVEIDSFFSFLKTFFFFIFKRAISIKGKKWKSFFLFFWNILYSLFFKLKKKSEKYMKICVIESGSSIFNQKKKKKTRRKKITMNLSKKKKKGLNYRSK